MTATLVVAVAAVPAILALLAGVLGAQVPAGRVLLVLAPLPALVAALALPAGTAAEVPWLLLGTIARVDDVGRLLLLMTAMVWLAAAVASAEELRGDPMHRRYEVCFLLALAGNMGLLVAGDVASFYLFFALMTFSAYGLVVHDGTEAAHRAGRVYITLAVIGEGLLLAGILLTTWTAGTADLAAVPAAVAASNQRDLIVGLLLAGFGVKAGAPLLHVWLPLAHPAAPAPASAVLSGCMIKAGLVGWLRFLPLGADGMAGWGALCVAAGLVGAFGGVLAGVVQQSPKAALAYSSVSQMGSMLLAVGAALVVPEAAGVAVVAAVVFAFHHGFAKAALFLGAGLAHLGLRPAWRRATLAGMGVAALALAGAPLSSGSVAKYQVAAAVGELPGPWRGWLDAALALTATATTLLMLRTLRLVSGEPGGEAGPEVALRAASGAVLVVATATLVWVVPPAFLPELATVSLSGAAVFAGLWPIGVGVAAAAAVVSGARRWPALGRPAVPPGDLVVPLEATARRAVGMWNDWSPPAGPAGRLAAVTAGAVSRAGGRTVQRLERRLVDWAVAGAAFAVLIALLTWAARS